MVGMLIVPPSGADRLDLDADLDVVADEDSASLERLVPGQPEVAPIDLAGRGEADPLAPPWILAPALVARLQRQLARRAADGEVADDGELLARLGARAVDALALEGDRL